MRPAVPFAVAVLLLSGCASSGNTHPTALPGAARPGVVATSAGAVPTAQQQEEARPGTLGWRVGTEQVATDAQLSSFADRSSVLPGQAFHLYVSSTSPSYTVHALRMGWYGGRQAREVWASGRQVGHVQAGRRVSAATGAVSVDWPAALSVSTRGWPAGFYLLRMDTSAGPKRFVPLVVRSAVTRGTVALMAGVNTYAAYDTWGSRDLYQGDDGSRATRSLAVSLDRPGDGNGAAKYFAFEDPLVHRAARLGIPLSFTTDVELDHDAHLLDGARGLVSLGHDEYWTPAMRTHALAARDHGTNLAFLGANAVYWRVRYAATHLGPDRLIVGYKSLDDPIRRVDPARTTVRFRDAPVARPENSLVGQLYECFPARGAFTVTDPDFFLYAGTGVRRGSAFPGLVGVEADRAYPVAGTPRPLQVVANSPTTCKGQATRSTASYYTTASGAGVFSAGTMNWVIGLQAPIPRVGYTARGVDFVRQVTDNLLTAMAAGPMGRSHPARDNLSAQHLGTRNTTGGA